MMAVSGAGLAIMEATAVEGTGRISHGCLGLYTDEHAFALSQLLQDVRTFGSAPIGIQLAHAGRKAACSPIFDNSDKSPQPAAKRGGGPLPANADWHICGPSALAFDETGDWQTPEALDLNGLARIRGAFSDAARRSSSAGFDMIEVHGAHGYLLHSFVSSLSNHRRDAYGGTLANRIRFPLEVFDAVRSTFPASRPVGYRLNGEDWADGGVSIDDAIHFACALKEAGVDYVTVSGGGGSPNAANPPVTPGYMVHLAERVKTATGLTTMAVGMILTPEQAEKIVAEGRADLVAIGRAFIDDPKWGWHAAAALGETLPFPGLQAVAHPRRWRGYNYLHPASEAENG
jgi:2,4-dienoyl-CoA reductase-like NADH-dependent reductase (Old Yellow Enzyme family)